MLIIIIVFLLFFIAFSLRFNWWRLPVSYDFPRILMYHSIDNHCGEKYDKWRVTPENFRRQMAYLKNHGWTSFTMNELTDAKNLPPKSFVVTFDDGYENTYTNALPILREFNFKATIYLLPNLKDNSYDNHLTSHVDNLLNSEQILQMQNYNIEFGAHTMNHVNLLKVSQDEAKNEIEISKKEVEKITSKPCVSFAYPYGKFDENIKNFVKNAGYKSAVVVDRGVWDKKDNFAIHRLGIIGRDTMFDFWLRLTRIRNKL